MIRKALAERFTHSAVGPQVGVWPGVGASDPDTANIYLSPYFLVEMTDT
jgi:hypothetical protein